MYAVGRGPAPDWAPGGVEWLQRDLLAPGAAAALVAEVAPEAVLHLAWETAPGAYWTSPANVAWLRASLDLAEAAAGRGARVVTAGTCAEYDWSAGWLSETGTPLAPATLYGRTKHALGSTLEALGQASGASFAHGRVFFLYGPHEAPARLVPSVTAALLRGERAPTTDGVQQRDFLHVDDVAAALVALLHADAVTGPVNIASASPVAVRDVVAAIADEVGRPDLVGWGEVERGASEPDLVAGDAGRLRDEVGFSPRYGLRDGIRATVDWWRGRMGVR